jgi:hypothetical protein
MKITKRQLTKIIKEELSELQSDPAYDPDPGQPGLEAGKHSGLGEIGYELGLITGKMAGVPELEKWTNALSSILVKIQTLQDTEEGSLKGAMGEGFFGGKDPAEALPLLKKVLSILSKNTDNKEALDNVISAIEALEYPEFAG